MTKHVQAQSVYQPRLGYTPIICNQNGCGGRCYVVSSPKSKAYAKCEKCGKNRTVGKFKLGQPPEACY